MEGEEEEAPEGPGFTWGCTSHWLSLPVAPVTLVFHPVELIYQRRSSSLLEKESGPRGDLISPESFTLS